MKRHNINTWLWFVVLVVFTLAIAELLVSGRILFFLHPKMVKFAYLSLVIFAVLSVYEGYRLFKTAGVGRKPFKWGITLYILPLILLLMRPELMDAETLKNKAVQIGQQAALTGSEIAQNPSEPTTLPVAPLPEVIDDGFVKMVTATQNDLAGHIGKTIELQGFVYMQDSFKPNEFVVSRLAITCCAADAAVIGILSRYDGEMAIRPDQWVSVKGVISETLIKDEESGFEFKMPLLLIETLEEIEPFDNPYVYE